MTFDRSSRPACAAGLAFASLLALALALASACGAAGDLSAPVRRPTENRVAQSCPEGLGWNGSVCAARQVAVQADCPAGSSLQEGTCVAAPNGDCPVGTSFQQGRGCVANVVLQRAETPTPTPTPDEEEPHVPLQRAETPTPVEPDTTMASGDCPAGMAAISGGTFTTGSAGSRSVAGFCMDVTEVTVAAYAACTRQRKCSAESVGTEVYEGTDRGRDACNWGVSGRDQHAMNCVDWSAAAAYCRAQSKRLPTEDEWEWAARGGPEGRGYPWGNAEPGSQVCWSGINRRTGTCVVGSHPEGRSTHGLQDMAGNVWEWTSSPYDSRGMARVVRGGGWSSVSDMQASFRFPHAPTDRGAILGFRCAR